MLYVYHYDVAALIVTGVLLLMYLLRKSYPTAPGRIFLLLMISTFLAAGFDLVTAFTISYADRVPVAVNYAVNMAYLLTNNLCGIIFFVYVLTITKGEKASTVEKWLWRVVLGVEVLLLLLTPITGWVFRMSEGGTVYEHGSLFLLFYVTALLMMIYDVSLFLRYRKKLNLAQTISVSFYVLAVIGAVAAQIAMPRYLITSFASSLVLILLYSSLERPSDFMYQNTYCYNMYAFFDAVTRRMNRSRFFAVIVGPENADYISGFLADETWTSLQSDLIVRLHTCFGQKRVFYLRDCHFAILCDGEPEKTVIEAFSEQIPEHFVFGDRSIFLSWRFRILPFPGFANTPEKVRNAVDIAIRQETGSAERVATMDEKDLLSTQRELQVLNCVRNGIRNGSFQIYYQPIKEEKSGKFRSAEALLRLNDPELGFIPPDEFIPVAERNGLIVSVGEYVFETVCKFWKENHLRDYGVEFIEVNLSTMQCMQKDLSVRVTRLMEQYGVPPQCINLEITESAAITNQAVVGSNMEALTKAGMAFSLDDFGTGYSNVDYLSSLPLKIVKIDKSILWKAEKSDASRTVLDHTLRMIRDLGMQSVVEGVETEKMVALLRSIGCDYYQGFLFSRPIPENEYLAFLQEQNQPA